MFMKGFVIFVLLLFLFFLSFRFNSLIFFFFLLLLGLIYVIRTFVLKTQGDEDENESEGEFRRWQINFEDGTLEGFVPRPESTAIELSDHARHDQSHSMRVFNRSDNWHGAQLDLTDFVVSGGEYKFAAYLYAPKVADYVMTIQRNTSSGLQGFDRLTSRRTSGEWIQIEGTYVALEGHTAFYLNFETDGDGAEKEFYVDQVTIDELSAPEEKQTQIFHQDFESHLGGFVARGSASVTRSTDAVPEGSQHSMKISERGSEDWHGAQVNITRLLVANGQYRFEAYVFGACSASYIMSLHVTGENVNPDGGTAHFPWIDHATIEGEWTKLTGVFTAPENFDTVFLNFETAGVSTRPDIYVDFVSIYALGATEIPDLDGGFDPNLPALSQVWHDYFKIGNIYIPAMKFDRRKELLIHHFDLITAENIMKPGVIQPAPGVFAFDLADEMLDFAEDQELLVIGHTLVWHQQSINWINEANTSTEEAIAIMKNHIKTVMSHYLSRNPGRIIAWDVVNEAIIEDNSQDPSDWKANLRDTKWLRLIGPDYIRIAFEYARTIDPATILYYNDYNLNHPRKATSVYQMVKELRDEGVPIDRIGMQGHYNTRTAIASVRNSLEMFSQIEGIRVSFTELDVTIVGAEQSPVMEEEQGILQGQVYAQLFQLFREYSNLIERVTFWGIDDANSWRADRFPTLFNEDLSAKPAFFGVLDPDKFLSEHPLPEVLEPQTAVAAYKTPKIGEFDAELWNFGSPIWVNNQLTAWEGAIAQARVFWDEDHIYALIDVLDPVLNDQALEVHHQDSVEVFLSQYNTRSPFYLEGDYQLRVSFRNQQSFGSQGAVVGFESATEITATGYRVEMKIPLQSPASLGRILGFDLQVNDANAQGVRQSIAKWNDLTDMSWQSTENWGQLELVGHDTEDLES